MLLLSYNIYLNVIAEALKLNVLILFNLFPKFSILVIILLLGGIYRVGCFILFVILSTPLQVMPGIRLKRTYL